MRAGLPAFLAAFLLLSSPAAAQTGESSPGDSGGDTCPPTTVVSPCPESVYAPWKTGGVACGTQFYWKMVNGGWVKVGTTLAGVVWYPTPSCQAWQTDNGACGWYSCGSGGNLFDGSAPMGPDPFLCRLSSLAGANDPPESFDLISGGCHEYRGSRIRWDTDPPPIEEFDKLTCDDGIPPVCSSCQGANKGHGCTSESCLGGKTSAGPDFSAAGGQFIWEGN